MVRGAAHGPPYPPGKCPKCPHFLPTPLEAKTSVGAAVNLTCGIRYLGDSKVSWIRRDDLHVLTTELMTYTSDKRFRAAHVRGSPFWTLEVNSPRVNDSGVYECQVSSQPKIFRRIKLDVTVPVSRILGSTEVYMKAGSDINITCLLHGHKQPTHVNWYHFGNGSDARKEVNAGERGGIQLVTDRRTGTSWLLVHQATWRDAGNYTCAPDFSVPSEVQVHILQDEETAAMQPHLRNSSNSSDSAAASTLTPTRPPEIAFVYIFSICFSLLDLVRCCW
ncbi:Immunoglobulin V-set domain [Trinorchestia longiramus]|nr:Immunoglobulin V-set domain [Trinorchestia longiramus]